MPYRFLEELATADIAFQAWGRSLEELFQAAADATLNVMIEDLSTIRPKVSRRVRLQEEALDLLLFSFLQELIYFKDAQQLLLRAEELSFRFPSGEEREPFLLQARLRGERLDPSRHQQRVDVKAVTLHQFKLERREEGWIAQVILDI